MCLPGGSGWKENEEGKGDQIHSDGMRVHFGQWADVQYTDNTLENCSFETYIMLLTYITLINLILKKEIGQQAEQRSDPQRKKAREENPIICLFICFCEEEITERTCPSHWDEDTEIRFQ